MYTEFAGLIEAIKLKQYVIYKQKNLNLPLFPSSTSFLPTSLEEYALRVICNWGGKLVPKP